MFYLGIDLGTSAVKILLVTEKGEIRGSVTKDYPLMFPKPGWSEQSPELWREAVKAGIRELLEATKTGIGEVAGIGCGGQMHGLVILDAEDRVIRPAILWNDGRTSEEVDYLNGVIGKEVLSERTANIAFAGFTAPKILWVRKKEPEHFARISKIMLPKDYINYKLTGVHACDYSDASGMLLLDVKNRCWSQEMLDLCGITEAQMPHLFESYEIIGTVSKEAMLEMGLAVKDGVCQEIRVAAGAGDNAAAAVGTGTVKDGACNISLGTSGTIFISSDRFAVDPNNALHAFAHANGKYHLMGCMLSAASCNKWLCEEILHTKDFAAEQADITEEKLGRNHVWFLPYLMGERSPINDTDARGTFTGLSMDSTRPDLVQAVLEGVAFAIRDSFEVAKSLGLTIEESCLCGGGARSPLWRRMIANILNIRLNIPAAEEGPGYGGAMLAMVGCGVYASVEECADALVKIRETVSPEPEIAARYEAQYQKFKAIYPAMKELFKELQA